MAEWRWTEAELEAEIDAAMRSGAVVAAVSPRATTARYEPATARLVVELTNGAAFMVPVTVLEGLADAPAERLAEVEVVPGGESLRWDALDVDLGVPGLLVSVFGSPRWMRDLAQRAA